MSNSKQIIETLMGLVYDLYPDEEYEELYEVKEKLAQAQAFINQQDDRDIEHALLINELEHNK
jgi:hypothetical protein